MKIKTITISLMLAAALNTAYGQGVTDTLRNSITFSHNHTKPDDNGIARLAAWTEPLQDSLKDITRINVYGYDSPDNGTQKAHENSERRAANTAELLADLLGMTSEQELENIKIIPKGTDWDDLNCLLRNNKSKWANKALKVTENTPLWIVKDGKVTDGRNARLRKLESGRIYENLKKEIFPSLRRADIEIILQKDATEVKQVPITINTTQKPIATKVQLITEKNISKKKNNPVKRPVTKNILDVKTNLLLPAMNVGIAKAVGKHFSLEGSWYYPWIRPEWINNTACFEVVAATISGRYWFKEKSDNALLGHSVGLSITGAMYDLGRSFRIYNWKLENIGQIKGIQGQSLGIDINWLYAIPVGKTLRMEFCIGAGTIYHEDVEYAQYGKDTALLRDPMMIKSRSWYIGPTKAEVNLVIPINYTKR